MTLDFLVHPEFGSVWHAGHDDQKSFIDYIRTLMGSLREMNNPVLIASQLFKSELIETTPAQRVFFSNQTILYYPQAILDSGQIHPEQWQRFTGILDASREDSIRVHGCYFGMCVKRFAIQAFAYLTTGEQFFVSGDRGRGKHESDMLNVWERDGAFTKGAIKYGITMAPPLWKRSVARIVPAAGSSYGNVNYQLMDVDTQIFGEY